MTHFFDFLQILSSFYRICQITLSNIGSFSDFVNLLQMQHFCLTFPNFRLHFVKFLGSSINFYFLHTKMGKSLFLKTQFCTFFYNFSPGSAILESGRAEYLSRPAVIICPRKRWLDPLSLSNLEGCFDIMQFLYFHVAGGPTWPPEVGGQWTWTTSSPSSCEPLQLDRQLKLSQK